MRSLALASTPALATRSAARIPPPAADKARSALAGRRLVLQRVAHDARHVLRVWREHQAPGAKMRADGAYVLCGADELPVERVVYAQRGRNLEMFVDALVREGLVEPEVAQAE